MADASFRFNRVIVCFLSLLVILSLIPFFPEDVDYYAGGIQELSYPRNLLGALGTRLGWALLLAIGLASYILAFMLLLCSLRRFIWRGALRKTTWQYLLCLVLAPFSLAMLLALFPDSLGWLTAKLNIARLPGGILGHFLCARGSGWIYLLLNWWGSFLLALMIGVLSFGVIWLYDWHYLFLRYLRQCLAEKPEAVPAAAAEPVREVSRSRPSVPPFQPDRGDGNRASAVAEVVGASARTPAVVRPSAVARPVQPELPIAAEVPPARPVLSRHEEEHTAEALVRAARRQPVPAPPADGEYHLPPYDLLHIPAVQNCEENYAGLAERINEVQEVLDSLSIDATVVSAVVGPQVTLFQISTASGYIITRIGPMQPNIMMGLKATTIRMLLPIPGTDLIGIEVPNRKREIVCAHTLFTSEAWLRNTMQIPLLLGKNVRGQVVLMDLAEAPHLLIAGSTGSGKSVCTNLMLASMLYRFTPDELRLILVDPKVVELSLFKTLPHLIVDVITEVEKVSLALRWAVNEMERRCRLLAMVRARNLHDFNRRRIAPDEPLDDDGNPLPQKLPYIVILIDEMGDVMLHAQKEVEKLLQMIAAKSRATGMHTILATQRPDVKVITGGIKANYPVRIAFRTVSWTDSKTILDGKGAEGLLGKGDMLYRGYGGSDSERVQGGWISSEEAERVVEYAARQRPQQFDESVFVQDEELLLEDDADDESEEGALLDSNERLLRKAMGVVLVSRKPTISFVQRRLGIGYNKAANLIEQLETRGYIGPQPSSGMREILISSLPWHGDDDLADGDPFADADDAFESPK